MSETENRITGSENAKEHIEKYRHEERIRYTAYPWVSQKKDSWVGGATYNAWKRLTCEKNLRNKNCEEQEKRKT